MIRRGSGFTLIELIIAMALTVVLVAGGTLAILQLRVMVRRVQARQQIHSTARTVYERLYGEFTSLMQTGVVIAKGDAAPGAAELVFLRGKSQNQDFLLERLTDSNDWFLRGDGDLVWSRLFWDGSKQQIELASSRNYRRFIDQTTVPPRQYINLPTPRQTVAADHTAPTTLNANAYGSGNVVDDVGDYQDLVFQSVPLALHCTWFRIEIVTANPVNTFIYDPNLGAGSYWADGMLVDSRVATGNTSFDKRPRLIRIGFKLEDAKADVSEQFSYSFLVPALAAKN